MNELLIALVPPAITGLATVVAALIESMRHMDSSARNWARAVTVLGPIVTVVLAVGILAWSEVRESVVDQERLDFETHTLNEFPESPSQIRANQSLPDIDATSVLAGAGPDRWQLPDGTSIAKDQVFYVDGWEWVDLVFPAGDREEPDATCGIEALGTLTTHGFSSDRNAALVEYTAPGDTAGTPCETGTYFFYPLPLTQ